MTTTSTATAGAVGGQADARRLPALDGLRGVAVAAVIAYHLGAPWMAGGYLGVDLFFVLSGFLITTLLLDEQRRQGAISLLAFWGRRARRLLPGLLLLLLVLSAAATLGLLPGTVDPGALRGDVLATLAYVANWHQLLAGQSYFARFAAPSPLAHAWSLAIEEQFYVIWPPVLAGALWLSTRLRPPTRRAADATARGARRRVLVIASFASIASATWMAWLAAHGASADRLYYGTDTRAFDLLAGAALAAALVGRSEPGARARRRWHAAGLAGAGLLAWAWVSAGAPADGTPPRWVFEGGMALCALAALAVLADARLARPGPLGVVLQARPLRFLGRISYALYLWHWPVIVELTPAHAGVEGAALVALRLAVMAVAAVASTLVLEERLRRSRRRAAPGGARRPVPPRPVWLRRVAAPLSGAGVAGALVVVMVSTTLPAAAAPTAVGPAPATSAPVAGSGGLSGEPALSMASLVRPTSSAPLRVTLIGDSVMRAQAPAVTAALSSTGAVTVTDMAYDGWGLTNDPAWSTGVPAMLRQTRPQLVVGTWSWDDSWALTDPAGYGAALARFLTTMLDPPGGAPGARAVVLEQFPPLGPLPQASGGPPGQARRVAGVSAWNRVARSMPALFPGRVLYLPVAPAVEIAGRYATWMAAGPGGPLVRVRSVDHTHFCPAGAARYAAALVADLHHELTLPPAGRRWWSGAWGRSAVYDTPPGSCAASTST